MKTIASLFLLFISLNGSCTGQSASINFFEDVDAFFKTYVKEGGVDYQKLAAEGLPASILSYIENWETEVPDSQVQKAFWINAYNILVIKAVIDNQIPNSPLDVEGFFDKTEFKVGKESLSLNQIENEKIRAVYKDARIHFALVCAANGCPPLLNRAYFPEQLEGQLHNQTVKAINNPDWVMAAAKSVSLSEIFKWYQEDFLKEAQSLIAYLNKYRKNEIPEGTEINFYPYNWKINIRD